MNSKQRAKLKSIASTETTILHIGKNDIGEEIIKQAADALKAREIIKFKVLETSSLSAADAAEKIAAATKSEIVQIIGRKGVLYKQNPDPKKRVIDLND